MLEDRDLCPIGCPRCKQQTYKEIGRLKREGKIRCSDCGLSMYFNCDQFAAAVDEAKKIFADAARSIRAADE